MMDLGSWFYGKDILIEMVSAIVLLVILFYAPKYYRMNREQKKYKYLLLSFTLLFCSFVFKIISHFIIYYMNSEVKHIGVISLVHQSINSSSILVFWGLLFYRILTILAFYFFFMIYSEKQGKAIEIFMIYLLLIVSYLSHSDYYIFHMTAWMLLIMSIIALLKDYSENKYIKTLFLASSFIIIALSQVVFIFIYLSPLIYVLAEIIQFLGYLTLLFTFIKIIFDSKKLRYS